MPMAMPIGVTSAKPVASSNFLVNETWGTIVPVSAPLSFSDAESFEGEESSPLPLCLGLSSEDDE